MKPFEAIAIVRRAHLSENLNKYCSQTTKSLQLWRAYLAEGTAKVGTDFQNIFLGNFLIGLTSHIDGLITDSLNEIYFCFPKKIGNLQVRVDEAFAYGNIYENMQSLVDKKVTELLYKSFTDQMDVLESELIEKPVSLALCQEIAEIKATRDLFAHGEVDYNDTYIRKAGVLARGKKGDKIKIDHGYIANAVVKVEQLVADFHASLKVAYLDWNKSKTFRTMWENSALESIMPFDEAWTQSPSEDMVRPTNEAQKWLWSHSEKELYKFFLSIYWGLKKSDLDIMYFFSRWPATSFEGTLLMSWLQYPFGF